MLKRASLDSESLNTSYYYLLYSETNIQAIAVLMAHILSPLLLLKQTEKYLVVVTFTFLTLYFTCMTGCVTVCPALVLRKVK